ncbi:CvpA family protein [Steroidobacter sp. S1-65]|uniref:CvpA family protein n=1 Tax=Steroidobacter gossypii TaxID=2805490 RepID=A0ABS1X186_9GAMM|nr:CvpA family protein [Steroidobacter gossypii]MBM0107003.1 CvpA family protein [Steroidobacter gossypii]
MNGADYLILGVLGLSMLLGVLRGFVREAIGVISWLGGLWLAWRYAHVLEPLLAGRVGDPPVSTWAARTLIVLGVLVIGWIMAGILSYMLRHSGLSIAVDRILGLVTGFVRGAVVVAVFVLLGQFVQLTQTSWWKSSVLIPYASEAAGWLQSFAETGMNELEKQARPASGSPRSALNLPSLPTYRAGIQGDSSVHLAGV